MEDIVALEATLTNDTKRYFLTWGRVFDPNDPTPLIECVRPHMRKYQLGGEVASIRVCDTLQQAAHAAYFFEALFHFAQCPVPRGEAYQSWKERMREELAEGKQLYYLGADLPASDADV